MAKTKIEWTATPMPDGSALPGYTFNPWTGCTKVSPACDHCYAEAWAKRSGTVQWGNSPRRRTTETYWRQPLKWNREAAAAGRRRRVFCASLADVFDNRADSVWRCDLWDLIAQTPHLDWLLLTKRPQNILSMLPDPETGVKPWGRGWPNVWLGTTVENQEEAVRRIPHLCKVPAAVRFLSCEPLLGPIDIRSACEFPGRDYGEVVIDWVICGGESGPGARPMHPDWTRNLRDQCDAAGVPFFFKQWGEWREFDNGGATEEVYDEAIDRVLAAAVRPAFVTQDARFFQNSDDVPIDTPARLIERVGKKAAGAMLDGREHRAFPDQHLSSV